MENSPRALLVFDHIPKTAGTTFRRSYLTAALPSKERWILGGGETNAGDRERFLALTPKERARIRIVAGHDAEKLRPHLPEARFITVVRDPVERTISSYLHARFHEGGEKLWPDVREQNMSLGQFADRYVPANAQSRMLLGEDYERLDDIGITQRLDARYLLVGYTEAFDEFVFMLHVLEGLPLCQYGNRLVRVERQSYQPRDDEFARVRAANVIDVRLHGLVKGAFQSRVNALTEPSRTRLTEFLASLRAFRAKASQ